MTNHIRQPLEALLILERAFGEYYYEGSNRKMKISTVIDLLYINGDITRGEFFFLMRSILFRTRPRALYLKKTIQKHILKAIRNNE